MGISMGLSFSFFTMHRAQSEVPDVIFSPICPGAEACAPEPNVRQEPNASQAIRLILPSPAIDMVMIGLSA